MSELRGLVRRPEGLVFAAEGMELRGDFTRMLPRIRQDRIGKEQLIRAARIKGTASPTAFDATAGLGEDSFLLAAAGFDVVMAERDPVIAALLADSLERARALPETAGIAAQMHLIREDSVTYLRRLPEEVRYDIIYLDPMFPERKKSGLVKKKMQLLKLLEMPCDDEEALLDAAFSASPRKIVIKRPLGAPCLGGRKPSYTIRGKVIRFDCIVL